MAGKITVLAEKAESGYMSTNALRVRVPADLKERLNALSASTGRPQEFFVREALVGHIDVLEWACGVAAEAEGVRSGQIETRPSDGLAAELGFAPHRPIPNPGGATPRTLTR